MSTLIYQSNGDHCTGKCDANCYDAKNPVCDCVCGGRNHGVGLKQATENTREYIDEIIEELKNKPDAATLETFINPEIYQLKLF